MQSYKRLNYIMHKYQFRVNNIIRKLNLKFIHSNTQINDKRSF